ncbi:hypothetical protein TNCV_1037761 [Trichonephila clavipes]|nr:hypothetical protein TNCV_1037761 [Trichonephila clavipes]
MKRWSFSGPERRIDNAHLLTLRSDAPLHTRVATKITALKEAKRGDVISKLNDRTINMHLVFSKHNNHTVWRSANIYKSVHHKVSHGDLHRSKLEAHNTKRRRITTQTSMPYPRFELRPYRTAVSVTSHYTGCAATGWYWARTHDISAMVRYPNHWATAAPRQIEKLMHVKSVEAQSHYVGMVLTHPVVVVTDAT